MDSLKFSTVLLSLLSLAIITQAQDPTFIYSNCPNTTTFTRNSTYQGNLNFLLSSLSSNETRNNINGFSNVVAGQDPDAVYGMFLCRGDVSNSVCQNCVNFAAKDVLERCPIEKVAIIWYDECELRYSNRNSLSTVDQDFTIFMMSPNNVTVQPDRFNQLVATTINDIAARAASVPYGAKKFAVQQVNYTGIQKFYTLVQCTPDLSTPDCSRCLEGAISKLGNCCNRKQGGRVLFASCNFRYELYEFYNATAAAEAAPPPPPVAPSPPPASGPETRRKGDGSRSMWIKVGAGLSAVIAVLFFSACTYTMRRMTNLRTEEIGNIREDQLLDWAGRATVGDDYSDKDIQGEVTSQDLPLIRLDVIIEATKQFSDENKLGQGGFGPVYRGTLEDGKEVAVKRLSRTSGQGQRIPERSRFNRQITTQKSCQTPGMLPGKK